MLLHVHYTLICKFHIVCTSQQPKILMTDLCFYFESLFISHFTSELSKEWKVVLFLQVYSYKSALNFPTIDKQKNPLRLSYCFPVKIKRSPHGVIANVLDCDIIGSEFKHHSRYYVHFRTNTLGRGRKPLIL